MTGPPDGHTPQPAGATTPDGHGLIDVSTHLPATRYFDTMSTAPNGHVPNRYFDILHWPLGSSTRQRPIPLSLSTCDLCCICYKKARNIRITSHHIPAHIQFNPWTTSVQFRRLPLGYRGGSYLVRLQLCVSRMVLCWPHTKIFLLLFEITGRNIFLSDLLLLKP